MNLSTNDQILRTREHLREMRFYGVILDFLNNFLYAIACNFCERK